MCFNIIIHIYIINMQSTKLESWLLLLYQVILAYGRPDSARAMYNELSSESRRMIPMRSDITTVSDSNGEVFIPSKAA